MDFMEQYIDPDMIGFAGGIAAIVLFLFIISILKTLIKVTFPDKLLVITGRKRSKGGKNFGFSVERGRTNVIPYFQTTDYLDLRILPINVRVEGVNSANGITVGADATACVCIDDDNEAMLYSAVEKLMGKTHAQIHEQVQQTLVGNFRGALNKATPLESIGMADSDKDSETDRDRASFRNELLNDINSDLSSFGMKVVSVSFQKIWDTSNYIANLAQNSLSMKRQDVEIEEARLRSLAEQAESDSKRRISVAKSRADEKILEAREKLELYKKESEALINKSKLEADSVIEEAKNSGEKDIQEQYIILKDLKNSADILTKEDAKREAAEIISKGEQQAVSIKENSRNSILKQKVDLLNSAGESGNSVLFLQQQLSSLFNAYKEYAKDIKVDSLVIMDNQKGFNGAVNRGPEAFGDFLNHFESSLGIRVKDLVGETKSAEVK